MSKENKIQEKYFYKREVKIWKNDVRAVSKLGYKGLAAQTLIMDLIVESQFNLTLEDAVYEAEWIGLTEADIAETIETYKDLHIDEDNNIISSELQKAVLKDQYYTKKASNGGYKSAIKNKRTAGQSWEDICKNYNVDVNEVININTTEDKIEYIIKNKQ